MRDKKIYCPVCGKEAKMKFERLGVTCGKCENNQCLVGEYFYEVIKTGIPAPDVPCDDPFDDDGALTAD